MGTTYASLQLLLSKMKVPGGQFKGRIAEVHWDPAVEEHRMMRFRDKPTGEHNKTVRRVM